LDEVVSAVVAEALALVDPDQPLVVFAESFGGLVGYEVTRRLGSHGRWPLALVLAACEPPHLADPVDDLVDAAVHGMATAGVDEDTRAMVTALIRKDLALADGYRLPADPRLDSAVHVWGGADDDLASADKLDAWRPLLGAVDRRQFPGGHVFAMHAPEIPVLLSEILSSKVASR
jgi:surfactin synthase thioesterase subunit